MRSGIRPVFAGIAGGLLIALAASRSIRALLFGVSPADPAVLGGAIALLIVVALAATLLPARAAARVDPLQVLRLD